MENYDFIALGGGSAGLTAAHNIRKAGLRTAVIDSGPIGGLCALNGCNPKKVLVRSAQVLDEIRNAAKFGIDIDKIRIEWSRVIDRKETFTRGVTESTESQLKRNGIDLFQGKPRLLSKNTIQVNSSELEARGILIATGSMPRPLQLKGSEFVKTSDDILTLRQVPKDLVILGAGVVAFEFAHVFVRLGSRVSILTPGRQALPKHDAEMVQALVDLSKKLGVVIMTGAEAYEVKKHEENFMVEYRINEKSNRIQADFILNAAGRIASIGDLSLESADVKADGKGVVVNEFLRSPSNSQIFAAGDAHGRMQLSPAASYEGGVVSRNFLEGDVEKVDYRAIPQIVFTIPPLAAVGLTEAQARDSGLNVSILKQNVSGWKVYRIHGETVGIAKLVLESGAGKILGAHLLGADSGEEIHLFAMAIQFGLSVDDLKKMVFGYPVLASALPYVFG